MDMVPFPFFEVWGINVQGDEELLGAAPTLLLGHDDSHEELQAREVHLIPRDKCWRTLRFSLYSSEKKNQRKKLPACISAKSS